MAPHEVNDVMLSRFEESRDTASPQASAGRPVQEVEHRVQIHAPAARHEHRRSHDHRGNDGEPAIDPEPAGGQRQAGRCGHSADSHDRGRDDEIRHAFECDGGSRPGRVDAASEHHDLQRLTSHAAHRHVAEGLRRESHPREGPKGHRERFCEAGRP